jgi:hypothetical protein
LLQDSTEYYTHEKEKNLYELPGGLLAAFYHLVKYCDFVKDEIRDNAFMIVSNAFSSAVKGAFGPI